MPLTITNEEFGDFTVLVVGGELDLATAPQLTSAALGLAERGTHHLVVDARRLTFCDSAGLTAFVRVATRLKESDGRLAVAGPTPIVRRVLELSGLVEAIVVVETLSEAVDALKA
jgi:anti-anti-sigma factor